MNFLALAALAGIHAQTPMPVLWLAPSGEIEVAGKPIQPRITPGAWRIHLPAGYAYSFNGTRGGILLGDQPALRLTGSITVSTWIDLKSYANDGPGAQILFRGDDRNGRDPYSLCIHGDGTIAFGVQDADDHGFGIAEEIPLNRWVHVLASFNAGTGELQLWLNHDRVAYARTSHRPFANLDPAFTPGVGIGNVQNDHGPHNQPLNGMVADLRLYDQVYEPDAIDTGTPGWNDPPVAQSRPILP